MVECVAPTTLGTRCRRRFVCANVGSTALVLDFRRIRIALKRVFNGKTDEAEIALDLFPSVEDQVQRNFEAPKIFFVQNFEADVKCEEELAAWHVKRQHVAPLEFDGRVQFACLFEHTRRKIDAKNVHAAVMQITRYMPRAAAQFANAAGSFDARRELI